MVVFHSYVSLPEGSFLEKVVLIQDKDPGLQVFLDFGFVHSTGCCVLKKMG